MTATPKETDSASNIEYFGDGEKLKPLQRNGFSRESARFIKENPEYVVKDGSTGKLKLKTSLSKCGRTSIENEVEYIRQNVPGIFVDEED